MDMVLTKCGPHEDTVERAGLTVYHSSIQPREEKAETKEFNQHAQCCIVNKKAQAEIIISLNLCF